MHKKTNPNGFSLVELSIVLVILGLLVGGILGGKSLIRAAELRSVVTEYEQWQMAIHSFRQKYHALPGDMRTATRFWGAVNTTGSGGECANPATVQGTGKQTCNGNGDGQVQGNTSYERFRFWQHLANAELIGGEYSGIVGSAGGQHHQIGINAPASRISGAGWSLENDGRNTIGNGGGGGWLYAGSRYHLLALGAETANNDTTGSGKFTPEEVWGIDIKLDDGKPGLGKVQTHAGCTTVADWAAYETAEYALNHSRADCVLLFPNAL